MTKSILRGVALIATLVAFGFMLDAQRSHSNERMNGLVETVANSR